MILSDYLKSNCRSWEIDCDSLEDTLALTSLLSEVFPELSRNELFEAASDWTGYDEEELDS